MTLINNCRGMALEIVQRSEAPNNAWGNLESHYRAKGKLRKCVIVVTGLSADYEIGVRVLDNNPAGLERAEIERVIGNQYNRLLTQQHDSKDLSASGSITTADRGEKKRRPRKRFEGNCFNCGRKGRLAESCRSVKKNMEKSGVATADKKDGGRGKYYVCRSEEHLAHKRCGLCRSLEHRTHDCENEELRRVRWWPKQMYQRVLRWDW